jgi:regulator of protease activity HflC (stomatin/prohibitin superfamily)
MILFLGCLVGFIAWFLVRYLLAGLYSVDQNERAVKTSFGRAECVGTAMTVELPFASNFTPEQKELYNYPQVRVIPPGGPYFKWPWERVYKVTVATQTINMAIDPDDPAANDNGSVLEAVTKDQLNTGLKGQIRWHISERNLYAYLFGIRNPITHVMGYFVSILRERIANFEAPANISIARKGQTLGIFSEEKIREGIRTGYFNSDDSAFVAGMSDWRPLAEIALELGMEVPAPGPQNSVDSVGSSTAINNIAATAVIGISINDLRKNLSDINDHMDRECGDSAARYGIFLDASLITGIDPPVEVESALAAINTTYNQVSSDISLAQAAADQKIVQSKRAVEIETLKAQAEVQPIIALGEQLEQLKESSQGALDAYVRNVRLKLFSEATRVILEEGRHG